MFAELEPKYLLLERRLITEASGFLGEIGVDSILTSLQTELEVSGFVVEVKESFPGESGFRAFRVQLVGKEPSGLPRREISRTRELRIRELAKTLPDREGWKRVGALVEVGFEGFEVRGVKLGSIWWWSGSDKKFWADYYRSSEEFSSLDFLSNTKILWMNEGEELSVEKLRARLDTEPSCLRDFFDRPPERRTYPMGPSD